MEGIFNSKDLLSFLLSQNFTSPTRKLTYYFNAIKKDLPPDEHTLQIYLTYIDTLKDFETADEIRRIYRMMELMYMRYRQYWEAYLGFEIAQNGRVAEIVGDAIKSISTKTYKEREDVLRYLNAIKNMFVASNDKNRDNGSLYFLEERSDMGNILKSKKKMIGENIDDRGFNDTKENELNMKFNNYKFNKDRNECSKDSNEYSKDKYSNAYSKDKYSNEYSQDKYRNEYSKDEYSKSNVISNIPNKNNSINNHYTHKNNSIHPVNSKEIKKFSCKMITDDYSLKLTDQIKLLTKENKNLKNSNDNNNTACNTNLNLNKDLKYITLKDKKLLILRLIGTGGSSKVYQVLYNNRNYALKKVNMNHTTLYRNEIKMLEKLRGFDGIIEMVDYEVKEDEILILMEYGDCDLSSIIPKRGAVNNCFKNGRDDDGETDNKFVDSFISDNSKNNHQNTLSVAYIRSIWEQIILIMKRVYEEKIVHCDLKPQNFIFVKGRIKLIDFGISKMGLSDTTSVVNDNRGTVNYIAPEMVKNEKIRRSVDIWSLGCILYEMVYNRSIFEGNMLQKITFLQNNRVIVYEDKVGYENLIDVIKMCLRYDPEERVSINELVLENYVYQQEVGRKCRNNSNDQIMSRDKDVFKDKMSIMIPKIVDFVKNNKNLSNEDLVKSITRNLNLFL